MTERPTFVPPTGPNLRVNIPRNWLYTVEGVAQDNYHHVVSLENSNNKKQQPYFWSTFNSRGKPLMETAKGSTTYQSTSTSRSATLDLNFYYYTTQLTDFDEDILVQNTTASWGLQIVEFNKPKDAPKDMPDYKTIAIFVEDSQPSHQSGKLYDNMLVNIHLTYYDPIDLSNEPNNNNPTPPPPPPGTNPGYNPALDTKRPITIENYLRFYDTVFLIDDSGSMNSEAPTRWSQLVQALVVIADKAIDEDTDGIDMYFLNSNNVFKMKEEIKGVTDKPKVKAALDQVTPKDGTPTGKRVGEQLQAHIKTMDEAVGTQNYYEIKPLDLIVLTDGTPTDNPINLVEIELEKAAKNLQDKNHHPNHIGVQFVQIGNDQGADARLRALTRLNVNGMVDTVPYKGSFTPGELERVLLGGIHPNLRTQQPKP